MYYFMGVLVRHRSGMSGRRVVFGRESKEMVSKLHIFYEEVYIYTYDVSLMV
jgi:hypothetical protein